STTTFRGTTTQRNQTSTTTQTSSGTTTAHQTDTGNKKLGNFSVTVESRTTSTSTQDVVNQTQTSHSSTDALAVEDTEKSGDLSAAYTFGGIHTTRSQTVSVTTNGPQTVNRRQTDFRESRWTGGGSTVTGAYTRSESSHDNSAADETMTNQTLTVHALV